MTQFEKAQAVAQSSQKHVLVSIIGNVVAHRGPLTLNGLSGTSKSRLAIINNRTFSEGESGAVKTETGSVQLRCLDIRKESVVVELEGAELAQEVWLRSTR